MILKLFFQDGTCILHTLNEAHYLRTLKPLISQHVEELVIQSVLITKSATLVVYSEEILAKSWDSSAIDDITPTRTSAPISASANSSNESFLHTFSINGKPIKNRKFNCKINHICPSNDGDYIVCADNRGGIMVLKTEG